MCRYILVEYPGQVHMPHRFRTGSLHSGCVTGAAGTCEVGKEVSAAAVIILHGLGMHSSPSSIYSYPYSMNSSQIPVIADAVFELSVSACLE